MSSSEGSNSSSPGSDSSFVPSDTESMPPAPTVNPALAAITDEEWAAGDVSTSHERNLALGAARLTEQKERAGELRAKRETLKARIQAHRLTMGLVDDNAPMNAGKGADV